VGPAVRDQSVRQSERPLTLLPVAKSGLSHGSERAFAPGRWVEKQANLTERGAPGFMTEEKARYYAEALAQSRV